MVTTGTRAMERPTQQVPLESPKCPRCDSSNTKFCYYNNYSLAQPRHFCKACKRYWTRGGTLRNVPVGGGFRKNKKVKHSISVVDLPPSKPSPVSTSSNPNMIFNGLSASPNPNPNPNPNPVLTPGVSNVEAVLGFDPQPQMSGFGLGFSNPNGNYQDGSTNSHLSSYSLLGSSINTPTIASLLGENLNQQKYISNINGGFQGLSSLGEVKIEEIRQNYQSPNIQNHLEQIHPSDSTLTWNGAWFDTTNIGSISSLI